MKRLKAIIIGAGDRGKTYAARMKENEEKYEVVGVAEPVEDRRVTIQKKHNIPDERCFDTWEKILDIPKFADIAVIATMDRLHCEPTLKALELGYDVLLEKPAAPTPEECAKILNQARKYNRKVMICHVLRYTPFYNKLKEVIKSGVMLFRLYITKMLRLFIRHTALFAVIGEILREAPACFCKSPVTIWILSNGFLTKSVREFSHLVRFSISEKKMLPKVHPNTV